MALSALGTTTVAKAEGDGAPIDFSLEYSADPGCPDELAFDAALRARLPAVRRLATSEASDLTPLVRVRLPATGSVEKREISMNLPDGSHLRREMPESACVDAMQSMAVIAAMALEANQRAQSNGTPAAMGKVPAEEMPPVDALPPVAVRQSMVMSPRHVEVAVPLISPRASWQWSALAASGIEQGMAPSFAPAFALGLELRDPSPRVFSPGIRATGLYARRLTKRLGGADVQFRLLAGRLDFCPARLRSGSWGATVCAEIEAGQLRGSADHVVRPHAQDMTWLGLGLAGRVELAVSGLIELELSVSGRALPVHDRFILNPATEVYQVPVIAGDLLVGWRLHWR